jgi:hypothetical protein
VKKMSTDFIAQKFLKLDFVQVRYGCLKITRCNKDYIRVGKQGSTWDDGNTWDNATWDNS